MSGMGWVYGMYISIYTTLRFFRLNRIGEEEAKEKKLEMETFY